MYEKAMKEGEARGVAKGVAQGVAQGVAKGENKLAKLVSSLLEEGKIQEVRLVLKDVGERKKYYAIYGLDEVSDISKDVTSAEKTI